MHNNVGQGHWERNVETFLVVNITYILSFAFIDVVVHYNVPDVLEFGHLGLCLSPGRQWAPNCA